MFLLYSISGHQLPPEMLVYLPTLLDCQLLVGNVILLVPLCIAHSSCSRL